jgi:hypothetical protein
VNTQAAADVVDCSNPKNSKYYVVVVQVNCKFDLNTLSSNLISTFYLHTDIFAVYGTA